MNKYKIIFSMWTCLFMLLATHNFIPVYHKRIKTFFHFTISTILFTICFHFFNYFTFLLTANLIICITLLLEFPKEKKVLFKIIFILYFIQFLFQFLLLYTLKLLDIENPSLLLLSFFANCLTLLFNYIFKDYLLCAIFNKETNKYYFSYYFILLFIFYIYLTKKLFVILNSPTLYFFFTFLILHLSLLLHTEKKKTEDYIKNYLNIIEYSTFTEELLAEYKSFSHEYKNRLIIIKGLTKPDNKELHDYLNTLLEEKPNNNYYWLADIKNIPIPGLKGLINYKLLKMKELEIEIEVYISEEVANFKTNKLDSKEKNNLYTILGVILDNAIEASIESKEKIISLQLFKEENEMHIILANTFKSIYLEKLEEKGYSSKGKNRGIGLYLVKKIINKSKAIKKETYIINHFFIQKIKVKI